MTSMVPLELGGYPVLIKDERQNPSGSHKDRAVRRVMAALVRTGRLRRDRRLRLLVSSSGNFARAVITHTLGYPVEIDVITDALSPPWFAVQFRRFPHVRVHVVNDPDANGSHLAARLLLVDRLCAEEPEAVFLDQYADPLLPIAYEESLAVELQEQTSGDLAALFVPAGTGAMLCGLLRYQRANERRWQMFAADAEGSGLFHAPAGRVRCLSGYGNGKPTGLLRDAGGGFAVVHVADRAAVAMCHHLLSEGLFVGPSTGATAAAFVKVAQLRPDLIPNAGAVVLIAPDSGEAYADTVFNPAWLAERGLGSRAINEEVQCGGRQWQAGRAV